MAFNFIPDIDVIIDGQTYNNFNYSIHFLINRRNSNMGNNATVSIDYLNKNSKSVFLKMSRIAVDVDNPTEEHTIIIMAGYKTTGKSMIFEGTIDEVEENDNGGVTFTCTEGEYNFVNDTINKNFTPGTTVLEAVKNIMQTSKYGLGVIDDSIIDKELTRGYNVTSNLKEALQGLANTLEQGVEARTNKGIIYFVTPKYVEKELDISADTGVKSIKERDEEYLITMYLHNAIVENTIVNVKDKNGTITKMKVNSVSHAYNKNRCETQIEAMTIDGE